MQRDFGHDKILKNSFLLLRAKESKREEFRVVKLFLLFKVESKQNRINTEEQLLFVQFMGSTEPMNKLDRVLEFFVSGVALCMRLTTLK